MKDENCRVIPYIPVRYPDATSKDPDIKAIVPEYDGFCVKTNVPLKQWKPKIPASEQKQLTDPFIKGGKLRSKKKQYRKNSKKSRKNKKNK